ncbi:MAG: hypothetical protein H6767_04850 [Candidatus Peribacteria bacterium]|nr:MAG: hypothetical protein H6767_04850 [Candidatus Peribacteria bacterium]
MISYIRGTIFSISSQMMTILTAGGVGYDVHIHEKTYGQLLDTDDVEMYIYHHITESSQALF